MSTAEAARDPTGANQRLTERLLAAGKLDATTLAQVREMERREDEPLSRLLIKLGVVSERDVAAGLADIHGAPLIETADYPQQPVDKARYSSRFLRDSEILPIADEHDHLLLAMADPGDTFARESIRLLCNKPVRPRTALRSELLSAVDRLYDTAPVDSVATTPLQAAPVEQWEDRVSDAPVIRFVNDLIHNAVQARASDIHLEPYENTLRIRYRVDGHLRESHRLPVESTAAICARIKLLAGLDLAERRLPQGGRFELDIDGSRIDLRIATMPVSRGENVVMRILDRGDTRLTLAQLGFEASISEPLEACLSRGQGMILVTGPTGSGKTTTLYAALNRLNAIDRKLITVEDPIEYEIEGVNQIQIRPDIGLSFATALRSVLRLDPDVIMVGEIRDPETAAVAIQAGLTGHVVLSTLHTNDAASAVTRLADMGVEPYLISSTVTAVLAQRLVRTLCVHCRVARPVSTTHAALIRQTLDQFAPESLFEAGAGCDHCHGSGYRGRLAVGELLQIGAADAQAHETGVKPPAPPATRSLLSDGLSRVVAGQTSVSEVMRQLG